MGWQIQTACDPGHNRHQWAAYLDRDLPAQDKKKNRKESGGRLKESACRLVQRSIKLRRCLFVSVTHRAFKLRVNAGLGTDNVLNCSHAHFVLREKKAAFAVWLDLDLTWNLLFSKNRIWLTSIGKHQPFTIISIFFFLAEYFRQTNKNV